MDTKAILETIFSSVPVNVESIIAAVVGVFSGIYVATRNWKADSRIDDLSKRSTLLHEQHAATITGLVQRVDDLQKRLDDLQKRFQTVLIRLARHEDVSDLLT